VKISNKKSLSGLRDTTMVGYIFWAVGAVEFWLFHPIPAAPTREPKDLPTLEHQRPSVSFNFWHPLVWPVFILAILASPFLETTAVDFVGQPSSRKRERNLQRISSNSGEEPKGYDYYETHIRVKRIDVLREILKKA
jgi:hypothetical protein